MTPLEELRSIGSFSGAMFKVLEDFDARLKAVEAHAPMLSELKSKSWSELLRLNTAYHNAAEHPEVITNSALPDAATSDSVGTGVEALDVPGGISTITTSVTGVQR